MEHVPVDSSFIQSVAYDPETRELHVRLASGKTYAYSDVEPDHHRDFLGAPSIGAHFGKFKARYPGRLVK